MLIGAEIGPELRLVVARQSFEPTPEVAPQHRNAADHGRMSWQAVDGHCDIVERRGAHEVLPETSPNPTCPDAFLAGALRAQVDKADRLQISALGDPAQHAATVAVDAIPHDLAHKAPDLLEAVHAIEFGHAHRHLVAADLRNQGVALRVDEPGLAGCGPDARVALHPLHQSFEIARREIQIHVQLADIVKVLEAHRLQSSVEGLDDSGTDLPAAAIGALLHAQAGQSRGVLPQYRGGLIGRSVVHDYPERWLHGLRCHAVERAAEVLSLVPAGRYQQIAS